MAERGEQRSPHGLPALRFLASLPLGFCGHVIARLDPDASEPGGHLAICGSG